MTQPPSQISTAADATPASSPRGSLARVAVPMLIAALLGALAALIVTAGDPAATAEARVRLHDNVDWPEHDAVRLEILSWLDADTFNAANKAVGGSLKGLDAELPRNQSFLNVVANADDDASAITGLDVAIARLVERDEEFSMSPYRADLASAKESLASVAAELEAITPAADAGDANAINERGALTWRVEELEGAVDNAQRDLAKRTPRIYQIGETTTSDAQRFRRLRLIATSALVAALAVGAALTLIDGRKLRPRPEPLSS